MPYISPPLEPLAVTPWGPTLFDRTLCPSQLFLRKTLTFFPPPRLHEVLMDLQHQQLQQLTDWLDVTEARIKKMGAQPLGPDLEDVKHRVEEHKVGGCLCEPCGSAKPG